jgi:uncharacterized protein DUF1524
VRVSSPSEEQFKQSFARLSFAKSEHGIARFMLRNLEARASATGEVNVAGPDHVHIEHIYPQSPLLGERWEEHERYVTRLGNLTLLGRRLNEQIKNSGFAAKKGQAYENTRLAITESLLRYELWSAETVEARQAELWVAAEEIWPTTLV